MTDPYDGWTPEQRQAEQERILADYNAKLDAQQIERLRERRARAASVQIIERWHNQRRGWLMCWYERGSTDPVPTERTYWFEDRAYARIVRNRMRSGLTFEDARKRINYGMRIGESETAPAGSESGS